jgi:hypothetical protein
MRRLWLALYLLGTGSSAGAFMPVATVTSAAVFRLDGRSINTPGVTTFPLVVGDVVATHNGAAVLFFDDGSVVKVGVNSSIRIAGGVAKPKVVLLAGTLDYKLSLGSNTSVMNLDTERRQDAQSAATLVTGRVAGKSDDVSAARQHRPVGVAITDPKFFVSGATAGLGNALLRLPPVGPHF